MVLAIASAAAQGLGIVRGRVTDENGAPVAGATVILDVSGRTFRREINRRPITNQTTTDANGLFEFEGLGAPVNWTIRVEADGLQTASADIATQPGRLTEANFKLQALDAAPPLTFIVSAAVGPSWFGSFADKACDKFRIDLPFDDTCSSDTGATAFNVGASIAWDHWNDGQLGLRGGVFFGKDGSASYTNVATAGTVAAGNQQQVFNRATADLTWFGFRIGPDIHVGRFSAWPYYGLERTHNAGVSSDERQRLGVTDLSHSDTIDERSWGHAFGASIAWTLPSTFRIGLDVSTKSVGGMFPTTTPPNHSRAPADMRVNRLMGYFEMAFRRRK